jgi:transmembrane sensor
VSEREHAVDAGVSQAEDLALDWLIKKDGGAWSDEDEAAFQSWLAASWSNTVAYWRAEAAWNRAGRLSALRSTQPFPATSVKGGTRRTGLKIAAVLAIAIATGTAIFLRPAPSGRLYATELGGHETLALADGTKIELNTNTAVRVSLDRDKRSVQIEKGEAFFDVKHDASRPFTVIAGNARIVDLGTQFAVRRDGTGKLRVTLVEGRAELSVAGAKPKQLLPGDIALATDNSISIKRKTVYSLDKELSWRRGVLIFDNTTLADAAAQFNRYNRTKLVLANEAVANVTVGGTFAINDVTAFARVAKGVLGLRVEYKDGEILVSR